jgi:gliding motility-associated-like protein
MPGGMTTSTVTVSPLANTTYTVNITDANGCPASPLQTTVTLIPLPVVHISVSPNPPVFFPETLCFSGDTAGISAWNWNFGDNTTATTPSSCHDFPKMGTYCVTLAETSNFGCIDSAEKCVAEVGAIIPNVFSPNGDGVNDLWLITLIGDGITYYSCEIYDRWGLKMAELNLPMQGWEGFTTSGSPASDGAYYFTLSVSWGSDLSIHKAGFITLIR